jgi:hypothetical protein
VVGSVDQVQVLDEAVQVILGLGGPALRDEQHADVAPGVERLTVDTLFPFAQVMLRQAASDLEGRGVTVEVVGIRAGNA